LRPVFHHKEHRTEGHLFITVLAYQLVQAIRRRLKPLGQSLSWSGYARSCRCSSGFAPSVSAHGHSEFYSELYNLSGIPA
jgi:hypothetical protein